MTEVEVCLSPRLPGRLIDHTIDQSMCVMSNFTAIKQSRNMFIERVYVQKIHFLPGFRRQPVFFIFVNPMLVLVVNHDKFTSKPNATDYRNAWQVIIKLNATDYRNAWQVINFGKISFDKILCLIHSVFWLGFRLHPVFIMFMNNNTVGFIILRPI